MAVNSGERGCTGVGRSRVGHEGRKQHGRHRPHDENDDGGGQAAPRLWTTCARQGGLAWIDLDVTQFDGVGAIGRYGVFGELRVGAHGLVR